MWLYCRCCEVSGLTCTWTCITIGMKMSKLVHVCVSKGLKWHLVCKEIFRYSSNMSPVVPKNKEIGQGKGQPLQAKLQKANCQGCYLKKIGHKLLSHM